MIINFRDFLLIFLFFLVSSTMYGQIADEQILWLDELASPENWTPSEATVSKGMMIDGHPSINFHVEVDFSNGQKDYPIGWPRMYFSKKGNIPWNDYDRVEFMVKSSFSMDQLPVTAISFVCYDVSNQRGIMAFGRGNIPRKDEIVLISVPMSRFEKMDPINLVGFSVSERDYKDKDHVEFTIGAFRLRRLAVCEIDKMSCSAVRREKTATILPVHLSVSEGIGIGVPFEISHNGKVLRLETLPVSRCESTLMMDISELRLGPGNYVLTAYQEEPKLRKSANFTIDDSQQEEK